MAKKQFKWLIRGIARKCFHTSIEKLHYLKLSIDIEAIEKQLSLRDLIIKELSYDDFMLGNRHYFSAEKLESIKYRLSEGKHKAYGIIEDGKLLYSAWISLDTISLPIESYYCKLNDDEGYLEDAYCDPVARGRGYHSYVNYYRIKQLYNFGKKVAIVTIVDGNTPAMKVQQNTGFICLGHFYCGRFFGRPFVTLKKQKYDSK